MRPIEVLMVEDNEGDVVLMREAIAKVGLPYHITVACDGIEAVEYLYRRGKYSEASRPDLITLDLKLPRKNGCEVLDDIRPDSVLREIPLVILSSSQSELQIARSYELPAECYIEKPSTYQGFVDLVRAIETFRGKAVIEKSKGSL